MNICILECPQDELDGIQKPFTSEVYRYLRDHKCQEYILTKASAVHQIRQLVRQKFDVFINFCDGEWDDDCPGLEVVQALERLKAVFTGATSSFYSPTREQMKFVCNTCDIPTPKAIFAETSDDLNMAAATLHFPLIVKHPYGYGSLGLTKASRVETLEQLKLQAFYMIGSYDSALIEEYIHGREFSALVVENMEDLQHPFVYPPIEFHFPLGETFIHYDLK